MKELYESNNILDLKCELLILIERIDENRIKKCLQIIKIIMKMYREYNIYIYPWNKIKLNLYLKEK